jgi:hypothetical protein
MKKLFFTIFACFVLLSSQGQQTKTSFEYNSKTSYIKFYPNPASTTINFEFLKWVDRNYILQIYNFTGKKVFESTNLISKISVALDEFYRGIYIFQLRDKSGRITESGKFQVIK